MKKIILGLFLIVFLLFTWVGVAHANIDFNLAFGGQILNTEAVQVTTYEAAGYDCLVPGSTVEIYSVFGPTSYFIPSYVAPVTGYALSSGQQILGVYSGQETIVCTRDEEKSTTSQVTIILPIIYYFGTSEI